MATWAPRTPRLPGVEPMTVIAYRDGIVAADTSSWTGDIKFSCGAKIHRLKDGSLVGAAGWLPVINRAIEWLDAGADPKQKPAPASDKTDIDMIWVRPGSGIWYVHENFEVWRSEVQDMAAAGSHHEFVVGAMLAGASAPAAVQLAIDHCKYAGGRVVWERIDLDARID